MIAQDHKTARCCAGTASLEFVKPLPDKVFRATLHAEDVLLVNEKPSRSGGQLRTVKSRTAQASDRNGANCVGPHPVAQFRARDVADASTVGPNDSNQQSNIESTTIR